MEWMREDPHIRANDTRVFQFEPRNSTALLMLWQSGAWNTQSWELSSNNDWTAWFKNALVEKSNEWEDGIFLIFGSRSQSRSPDPSQVCRLPFSREIFERISKKFMVHSSIARVINRNTTAHCSRHFQTWDSCGVDSIVYNCRSAASWPEDIALSTTFLPARKFTYAIMYGCTDSITNEVVLRLSKCELKLLHSLVLPTIFAEIERNRHFDLVESYISKLTQRVLEVGYNAQNYYTLSRYTSRSEKSEVGSEKTGSINTQDSMAITEWLEISHLRGGLENWKIQLLALIEHVQELGKGYLSRNHLLNPQEMELMGIYGARIEERLLQIINEYDDKVRACSTALDGMTFATQMEWNQIAKSDTKTNLEIAQSTMQISEASQRDGKQMKSIAILTTIFLPGTFAATLFSMTFFDWKSTDDALMSPYIWIYVVVTVVLTAVAFGALRVCSRKPRGNNSRPSLV